MNILRAQNAEGNLLIGVGENCEECLQALGASLMRADIPFEQADDLTETLQCLHEISYTLEQLSLQHPGEVGKIDGSAYWLITSR